MPEFREPDNLDWTAVDDSLGYPRPAFLPKPEMPTLDDNGIDLSGVRMTLELSPMERLDNMADMERFILEARDARSRTFGIR